jgi:hypothetical protein
MPRSFRTQEEAHPIAPKGAEEMARRKRSNKGAALARVEEVLVCARRVAVHSPERDDLAQAVVPGVKLYRLRLALEAAGVDMGKARNFSEGAIQANKTIKANKG